VKAGTYLRSVSSQVVVGPQGMFQVPLAMGAGVGDSNDASYISCSQPSFLVVVVSAQLETFLLKPSIKHQGIQFSSSTDKKYAPLH